MTDLPRPPADDPTAPARGDDGRALDADERALATLVAMTGSQTQPSTSLDARIRALARVASVTSASSGAVSGSIVPISSAHASATSAGTATPLAIAPPPVRIGSRNTPRARRPRWPAITGIAATLTLAFGLAWQMRPQDEPLMETSDAMSAPAAKARGASGPRPDDSADTAQSAALPPPGNDDRGNVDDSAAAAEPSAEPLSDATMDKSRPPAASASPDLSNDTPDAALAPAAPVTEPEEAPAAFPVPQAVSPVAPLDPPEPMMPAPPPLPTPAPVPMPVPAPMAPRPAASSTAPVSAADRSRETEAKQRQQTNAEAGAAASKTTDQRAERERIEVTGTRLGEFGDQPLDDQPPASADSPAVRDAWLERVRQLVADGRTDAARASLREYRRRHPDAPIPDDLRLLLPDE